MGIIARQTIKGSIYSYLGAIIGFINVGLIMPQIFSTAQIGLTSLLISISAIFGQFGSMGFVNVTLRLFPYFRDIKKKHNGFLFMLLSVGSFGFILCAIAYYLAKPYIISENIDKSPLFAEYVYLLIPLIFISIFYFLIDTYNRILFNASFGIFVKEFLLRFLNLGGIVLFYFNFFDFNDFIIYYTLSYGIPVLLISLLLVYKHEFSLRPSFKLFKKDFVKQILSVAAFGMISGFSGIVVLQLDKYLVNHYCDLSATGVYATAFFFGTIILLPGRSLIRISSSVIAEALKANEYAKIDRIYKKSTLNLMILGLFLFLLMWGNINNIMTFLPPEFETGRYVIFFIALAHLLQMTAGVSGEIVQYSKYYRQHTVIMVILISSIIGFNLVLLPILGIKGASIAYACSFLIYSIVRIAYVKYKFGFQPFNISHLWIVLIAGISYFATLLLPQFDNFILDGIVRSILIAFSFVLPVVFFKLSPETNDLISKTISYLKNSKK